MMGSDTYGGKGYFFIGVATIGYFALTSTRIPLNRAYPYVAMFFLSGLTSLISNLVYFVPSLWFLYDLFPPAFASDQARADITLDTHLIRLAGVVPASQAIEAFMLARYGLRGVFDVTRPWRMVFFLFVFCVSLYGGYRSTLVLFGFVFVALFFIEGLWRTRFAVMLAALALIGGTLTIAYASRMPFPVQRTLSFLPFVEVDPIVRGSADSSSEWRINMWKVVLPEIPHYLLKGKGYALSGRELEMIQDPAFMTRAAEGAIFAGDFHNGPLSLVIPFGVYGLVAFLWLAVASIRFLANNYHYGHPSLRRANGLLLALFIGKLAFFLFIFGAIQTDLAYFTGILGFGVALNHGEARPSVDWHEEEMELQRA
jgi:hypothetical protein